MTTNWDQGTCFGHLSNERMERSCVDIGFAVYPICLWWLCKDFRCLNNAVVSFKLKTLQLISYAKQLIMKSCRMLFKSLKIYTFGSFFCVCLSSNELIGLCHYCWNAIAHGHGNALWDWKSPNKLHYRLHAFPVRLPVSTNWQWSHLIISSHTA